MYYIQTADRLTRTSVWLEKMGGIDFLRDVIINDRLGIAEELERQLQSLVDSYECEWKAVVNDPEKKRFFQQFANTDLAEPGVEFVTERGQQRPADWPTDFVPFDRLMRPPALPPGMLPETRSSHWVQVGRVSDFPVEGGRAVKYGRSQIAVFRFASRDKWYAGENLCPHKREMVLARGIMGDQQGAPKVACPLHKKTFSLESGQCLSGEDYKIRVFPVKVEMDALFLSLPPETGLDAPIWVEETACANQCAVPCA
jgi:NAD(P)H-dependent nitrite reductase small subunit